MPEINDILKERGSRYGDFGVQARTAQNIRDAFEASPNWHLLPPYMKEALSLMTTKFSRMLTGDHMYMDNVVDLIGYMTLMRNEMEREHELIANHSSINPTYAEVLKRAAEYDSVRWPSPDAHSYYVQQASSAVGGRGSPGDR